MALSKKIARISETMIDSSAITPDVPFCTKCQPSPTASTVVGKRRNASDKKRQIIPIIVKSSFHKASFEEEQGDTDGLYTTPGFNVQPYIIVTSFRTSTNAHDVLSMCKSIGGQICKASR